MSSDNNKMFIGGLHPRTTRDMLIKAFSKYGEVADCRLPMKEYMNESKGFAFITFKEPEALQAAVTDKMQFIDGRHVEARLAGPRAPQKMRVPMERSNRVFVGGIRDVHSRELLTEFFRDFGTVTDVEWFSDKTTGKCRGFAFVVFDNCDTADKLIEQRFFTIHGVQCEVKSANRFSQRNQSDRDRECRTQRQRYDLTGRLPIDYFGRHGQEYYFGRQGQEFAFDSGCIAEKSGSRTSREEECLPQPVSWGAGIMWAAHLAPSAVYSPTMMQSYGQSALPFPDVVGAPPGYWIEGEQATAYVPHVMQEFAEDAHYEPYYAS